MMTINTSRPVALVTGASRKGALGEAICFALASSGHDIFLTYFSSYDKTMYTTDLGEPQQILAELRDLGVRAEGVSVDLSDPAAPDRVLRECTEFLGPPSVLVNNAAYSTTQPWDELTLEELDLHMDVNYRASTLLSIGFAKQFTRGHGGRIISMTSGQSLGPMPTELAYAASKGAIEAFVKSFSVAVGHLGITVNAVNPGPNDTGWMTDDLKVALQPKFALGRIGIPADVAKVVSFLASREADWITGQVLNIEGGFTRS